MTRAVGFRPRSHCPGSVVISDNLTILPASQLSSLEMWKNIAGGLPKGEALIVVPSGSRATIFHSLAATLLARGKPVTTISAASMATGRHAGSR